MNFLLHRHLAERDTGSSLAGIGAMLPDVWRMTDRRVRPSRVGLPATPDRSEALASVLAGIEHHVEADRWFHRADIFTSGERTIRERIRSESIGGAKIGAFAHAAWELCLDGALLRRFGLDATGRAVREGFAAVAGPPADTAVSMHHFSRTAGGGEARDAFTARMQPLLAEIAGGPWLERYLTGPGIARCIEGMRVRMGLGRLEPDDRHRLAALLESLRDAADQAVGDLV